MSDKDRTEIDTSKLYNHLRYSCTLTKNAEELFNNNLKELMRLTRKISDCGTIECFDNGSVSITYFREIVDKLCESYKNYQSLFRTTSQLAHILGGEYLELFKYMLETI